MMSKLKLRLNVVSSDTGFIESFQVKHTDTNKTTQIQEINNLNKFLVNLETGLDSFLKLKDITEIKLSTTKLPNNLVRQIIHLDDLLDALNELKRALNNPIQWHAPYYFNCKANCQGCCKYSYYLPQELNKSLKTRIRTELIPHPQGMWEINQKKDRCIFFSDIKSYNCTIHSNRPVRCKIYPFFPIVYQNKIHIYLESQIRMISDKVNKSSGATKEDETVLHGSCPGTKSQKNVKKQVSKLMLQYVNYLLDTPLLAKSIVVNPKNVLK